MANSEEPKHSETYNKEHPHIIESPEFYSHRTRGYKTREKYLEAQKRNGRIHRQRVKEKVLLHYGGKCICCGETNLNFLTLSHPNNDAVKHKNSISNMGRQIGGYGFYNYLLTHNFPIDFLVVIECYNCNCGARANDGICPHKQQMDYRLMLRFELMDILGGRKCNSDE